MKIAIIGATGILGQPVTHQLLAAGFDLQIIARNIAKAQQMFPGCSVINGDLKDTGSLKDALKDIDAVYLSLNLKQTDTEKSWLAEREGLSNLIKVAQQLDIKRIGFLSSVVMNYQGMDNFDWWVFRMKHEAVAKIKTSGIPYLIFYPSTFMESITELYKMGNMVMLAGKSETHKYWIAAIDYGKQVVRAFAIVPENESREYVIQGVEPMNDRDAVDIVVKNYNKARLYKIVMPEALLKFNGLFSRKMNYGYHIMHALNNYPEKFEAAQTWEDLGKPEVTLKEFAENIR